MSNRPEIHPALIVPPDAKLGPAMTKLNDRQRAFVVAMLEWPFASQTAAARAAGYSKAAIRDTASRLAHDEDVLAAIHEEAKRRLRSGLILGVSKLMQIVNDDTVEKKDQLKAIEMLLNRTGISEVKEQKIEVTRRELTEEQMLKEIFLIAKRLDIDPVKLLGEHGIKVIDTDFEEVPATEDNLADIY